MQTINILSVNDLKMYAKSAFRDVTMITRGFSLPCITVVFDTNNKMIVTDFDCKTGKSRDAVFFYPEFYGDMIKKIKHHCGEQKVNEQLNITHL